MLVLDRKVKEGFWIDGGIFVKVLDIGRRRVKLGIEAPGNVRVMREELKPLDAAAGPANGDADMSRPPEAEVEGSIRTSA
jgi:carbon storage regulator